MSPRSLAIYFQLNLFLKSHQKPPCDDNTLVCAHCVTVRGKAEDNPPIINVNGVDDEDFVVIDEDDAIPNGNVDEEDIPTNARWFGL